MAPFKISEVVNDFIQACAIVAPVDPTGDVRKAFLLNVSELVDSEKLLLNELSKRLDSDPKVKQYIGEFALEEMQRESNITRYFEQLSNAKPMGLDEQAIKSIKAELFDWFLTKNLFSDDELIKFRKQFQEIVNSGKKPQPQYPLSTNPYRIDLSDSNNQLTKDDKSEIEEDSVLTSVPKPGLK